MSRLRIFWFFAIGLGVSSWATAQIANPVPTAQQLALAAAEDQLTDSKCGVTRNVSDDYRPAPMFSDQTRAPRVKDTIAFKTEVVANGLANPYALALLPDGKMLVTIRAGGVRVVSADGKVSEPLPGAPTISLVGNIRQGGMQDIVLDRDFARNRTVYFTYTTRPEGATANVGRVASAKLTADDASFTDLKVLKEGAMTPRRVAQGPDGALYITTADVVPPYASTQVLSSPNGKVLRINTDGSIPKDNPFVSTPNADTSVYALGMRDPQSIAFNPRTGDLWIAENEPRGGDELNLIRPGKNYGFPLISYGRDNDDKLLNGGKTAQDGLEQPVYFWTPSVAFSGMVFYTGDKLPRWKDSVFAGGLSGLQLVRLDLNANGRVVAEEKLLRERCERIRDVRQGPDGNLYVLTDAAADGKILRIGAP